MPLLEDYELRQIKETFLSIDVDNSGVIDAQELRKAMINLNKSLIFKRRSTIKPIPNKKISIMKLTGYKNISFA